MPLSFDSAGHDGDIVTGVVLSKMRRHSDERVREPTKSHRFAYYNGDTGFFFDVNNLAGKRVLYGDVFSGQTVLRGFGMGIQDGDPGRDYERGEEE